MVLLASHWLVDTEAVRNELVTSVWIRLLDILIVLLSVISAVAFTRWFLFLRLILLVCVLVLISSLLSIGRRLIGCVFFTLSFHEKSKGCNLLQVVIVFGLPIFSVQLPQLENVLCIEGDITFSNKL